VKASCKGRKNEGKTRIRKDKESTQKFIWNSRVPWRLAARRVCTTLQTDHFLLLKLVISSLRDAQEKTWLARPDNLYPKCGFAISVSIEKALASDH
jgi:hypothetical protein